MIFSELIGSLKINVVVKKRNISIFSTIVFFVLIICGNSFVILSDVDVPASSNNVRSFTVKVPGNVPWTKTDIQLLSGEYVTFAAVGEVEITKWSFWGRNDYEYLVGPKGTYDYSDKIETNKFPLPSAKGGPIPCYSLIGKTSDNDTPFFIGNKCSIGVSEDGILYLGINDFDVSDNKGDFTVTVNISAEKPDEFELRDERRIEATAVSDAPVKEIKEPKVLLIYIDGLNYDVLKEMVFTGYLPNIKEYFFDTGADFINSFTTFPSSTFQSASATLSGMFLDMTGIKMEMFFDREDLKLDHYFKPFGPNTAARIMRPDTLAKMKAHRTQPVKLVYDFAADNKLNYSATILPVQHQSPPKHIMKTIANTAYFGAHHVHFNLDKINGDYALENVIKSKNDLMYVWLPGPDVAGHKTARGLWGIGRKNLYLIDEIIGKMMDKLKREKIFDQTYKILYSDHGHIGGKYFINQNFDITNDFFYKSIVLENGKVSNKGGLGFNVKFAEDERLINNFRPDTNENHFMVSAVEGFGMVNVYLPKKAKYSGDMLEKNTLHDLVNYSIVQDAPSVNVLEMVLDIDQTTRNQFPNKVSPNPVDLVLLGLDKNRMLIMKSNGSQAMVERKQTEGKKRSFLYRYKIIEDIEQFEDGVISFSDDIKFDTDPLEYLDDSIIGDILKDDPDWLNKFHTAKEWLDATVHSQYPDAVVQFSHFFLWDDSIKDFEKRYDPDFVITANKGWNFRSDGVTSTDHGYPFYETMRIPLLISGPNIKHNVMVRESHRIVDIMPTTLSLLGIEYGDCTFDGNSMLDFNDSKDNEKIEVANNSRIDREYIERYIEFPYSYSVPDLVKYPSAGKHWDVSIHDHTAPFDLHNIAADVKFTFDLSVFKVSDDVIDLIIPGNKEKPIETGFDLGVEGVEKIPDNIATKRLLELLSALRIRNFSISDLSMLSGNFVSENNFHRANAVVDWSQDVLGDFNRLLGAPVYRFEKGLIPGKYFNFMIDYPQIALEGVRKSLVEFAGRTVFGSIHGLEYGLGKITNVFKDKKEHSPEMVTDNTFD